MLTILWEAAKICLIVYVEICKFALIVLMSLLKVK